MKVGLINVNLMADREIIEHTGLPILVPESILEQDILISWITYDLKDDLGVQADDWDSLGRFYRATGKIIYGGNGRFWFDPKAKKKGFTNKDICFVVHRFREHEDEDGNSEGNYNDFELIWECGGVAQSVYETSVANEIVKQVD